MESNFKCEFECECETEKCAAIGGTKSKSFCSPLSVFDFRCSHAGSEIENV